MNSVDIHRSKTIGARLRHCWPCSCARTKGSAPSTPLRSQKPPHVEFRYGFVRSTKATGFAALELHAQTIVCRFGQEGIFAPMSADDERDAAYWRRLEAEARTIAVIMADPEPRRIMFFIAEGYKLLADRAELRKTQKD